MPVFSDADEEELRRIIGDNQASSKGKAVSYFENFDDVFQGQAPIKKVCSMILFYLV